jgi:hypothetical protein
MLEADDLCEGFRQMYECIRECDKKTNEFLLDDNDTCFPEVQRRAPKAPYPQKASLKVGHEVLNAKQKADRKTIAHVWDNYFASAVFHTLQLVSLSLPLYLSVYLSIYLFIYLSNKTTTKSVIDDLSNDIPQHTVCVLSSAHTKPRANAAALKLISPRKRVPCRRLAKQH